MSSSAPLRVQAALPLPGEKELEERKLEKEESDNFYRNEQCRTTNLIEEKGSKYKEPKLAQASYKEHDDSLEDAAAEKAPAVKQTPAMSSWAPSRVQDTLSDPSFWRDVEARIERYKESKRLSKSSGSKYKEPKLVQASYKEDAVCPLEDGVSAKKFQARAKKTGAKTKKGKKKAKKAKKPKEVTPPSAFAFGFDSTPGDLCNICDGPHKTGYCEYWLSVPPNAHVNDGYVRRCKRCGSSVGSDLKCPVHPRSKIRAFIETKDHMEYVLSSVRQSKTV